MLPLFALFSSATALAAYEEMPLSIESNPIFLEYLNYAKANKKEFELEAPPVKTSEEKYVQLLVDRLQAITAQYSALTNNERAYIEELIGDLYLTLKYNDARYQKHYLRAGNVLYNENPIGSMAHARGIELLKRYHLSNSHMTALLQLYRESTDDTNIQALAKSDEFSSGDSYCNAKKFVLQEQFIVSGLDLSPEQKNNALKNIERNVSPCMTPSEWAALYGQYATNYSELENYKSSHFYHTEAFRLYEENALPPDHDYIQHVGAILAEKIATLADQAKTAKDRNRLIEIHAPLERYFTGEQAAKLNMGSESDVDALSANDIREAKKLAQILRDWLEANPDDEIAESAYILAIRRVDDRPSINHAFKIISQSKKDSFIELAHAYSLLSTIYDLKGESEYAIIYQQIAVSYAIDSYNDMYRTLHKRSPELATRIAWLYEYDVKKLQRLYQRTGRLEESIHLIGMLKSVEYLDYTRTGQQYNELLTDKLPLSPVEDRTISAVRTISQQGGAKLHLSQQKQIEAIVSDTAKTLKEGSAKHGSKLSNAEPNQLIPRLGTETALLGYTIHKDGISIDAVGSKGISTTFVPIDEKDLNLLILKFTQDLRNKDSDPTLRAQQLYKLLILPVENLIQKHGAKVLLLSLDGNLRYIPFAALHDGKSYAIEKWEFPIYTALTRSKLGDPPQKKWSVAGFGVTKQWGSLSPLPEVKQELNSIVRSGGGFLDGDIYLDDSFTKASLKKAAQMNYKVVHIASHFVFSPGTETNSYLLLGNGDKMSLTDLKRANLRFDRADLLTLSACDTARGGGTDAKGKEIEGFGVLVQKQGAKSVLATLWRVDDKATSILMSEAYLQKSKGLSKIAAIRSAQIKLLTSQKYTHPFYWAPFVLMGNWQ